MEQTDSKTMQEVFDAFYAVKTAEVKASTLNAYRSAWEYYLREHLAALPVSGYGRLEARQTLGMLVGKGLGSKTVRDAMCLAKQMVKFAAMELGARVQSVDWRLKYPEHKKREIQHFSEKETQRIIQKAYAELCEGRRCALPQVISIMTGLRIGEVCGLRWSDIDFGRMMLRVRRTVNAIYNVESGKNELIIGSPKSSAGNREVPILPALKKCIKKCWDKPGGDDCYVCSNDDTPYRPRTVRQNFESFIKRHALPTVNFHGLRHTFATRLVEAGGDIKTISVILGHADVQTTMNLYVHPSSDAKTKAVRKAFKKFKLTTND